MNQVFKIFIVANDVRYSNILEHQLSLNPDYRIKKMGLEMHFVAQAYKNEEVSENTFQIPPHLTQVSKEEMSKIFTDL